MHSNFVVPAWLPRWQLSYEKIIFILALYFAVILNFPVNYRVYELAGAGNLAFGLSSSLALFACFLIIFSFFALPYLLKPAMALMLVSSAGATYAIWQYNILFSYAMVENILATNSGEALSYFNGYSIGSVILLGGLPAAALFRVQVLLPTSWARLLLARIALILVAALILAIVAMLFYKDYASVGRNNRYLTKMIVPAHIYYGAEYINRNFFTKPLAYKTLGEDAQLPVQKSGTDQKPTLVVLAVGETARATNMQYNGYSRNTNPYTQGDDLIALQQVSSCGTATAHSLPCMMSYLTHDNFERKRADAQDNVLDILSRAGVEVIWLENDGGDKHVAKGVTSFGFSYQQGWSDCHRLNCFDEVFIAKLEQLLANSQPTNKLFALHLIGSHGPTYYQRYPAEHALFQPACERSDIENCTDEEIVNVYDNTLAYTDYVLAQVIDLLERYGDSYNVALMYLSDHGESLGENGLYLHGTPYAIAPEEQTQVPWLIWLPQQYAQAKGINRDCLVQQAQSGDFSHDNLFHSLLGFYGVETQIRQDELDFTAPCRA